MYNTRHCFSMIACQVEEEAVVADMEEETVCLG
jgi:hypothetical protein